MNKEENENEKKIRLLQELADSLFFEEDVKPFLNELADVLEKHDFYLQIDYDESTNIVNYANQVKSKKALIFY